MILLVLYCYYKDCKEIGKDNLALSLKERLFNYFLCIPLPLILGLLLKVV